MTLLPRQWGAKFPPASWGPLYCINSLTQFQKQKKEFYFRSEETWFINVALGAPCLKAQCDNEWPTVLRDSPVPWPQEMAIVPKASCCVQVFLLSPQDAGNWLTEPIYLSASWVWWLQPLLHSMDALCLWISTSVPDSLAGFLLLISQYHQQCLVKKFPTKRKTLH